ncbi:NAD-dependent succinate-semialdehyde dehydrogenase [Methanolobus sp. ZRKC3]|uniref:NAD-dependent succinate-semialdehyde dehydrogenase n=1 Tax=Methanolobus sp. ZRKC3 TaxID=3125786 RepID=UPI00324F681B
MGKITSVNPATGETNAEFELYNNEMIDAKIKRSKEALQEWKDISVMDRAVYLQSVAKVLRDRKKELAATITQEMGKVMKESIAEIEKCAWTCEYFADNAEKFIASEFVETDAQTSGYIYEPLGTVLSIMPWNFPFWQALRFGIPALAGGNTVLLKHASNVPMCALEIQDVFIEAGLPEGVYMTLLVDGPTASSLISRDDINAVSFTGSRPAGEKVAEAAGRNMKKFILELGGSDPFLVLEDADVETAAKTAVASRFLNAGQSCIAAKRFIVSEEVAEQFTESFVENTLKLKVGDPMDMSTDMGPLVSEKQRETIQKQVDDTLKVGANVLVKGGAMEGDGFFYMPTVLDHINESAPVLREETFGPVAPIVTFKNEDEAVDIANNTEFGLGASIWSQDRERAMRMTKYVESGIIAINNFVSSDPRLPFGGFKKSGVGRELYKIGVLEFMTAKSMKVY